MKKQNCTSILSAFAIILLILRGETAFESACDGVMICIQSLIPTLFPFFIFSSMLTGSLTAVKGGALAPLERLCRIPLGSGIYPVIGFLGGYPVGAANIAQGYRNGQLRKSDAQRMLSFCSNAGPSFLFGILGPMFPGWWMPWLLWAIHIGSALIAAVILPGNPGQFLPKESRESQSLTEALNRSIRVMASVCGWVILFRIILGFLDPILSRLFPPEISVYLTGVLELANGCLELAEIRDVGTRLVAASGMLSFGGLCVAMQTSSVCHGLSIKTYLLGKVIQSGVSLILMYGAVWLVNIGNPPGWALGALVPTMCAVLFLRSKGKIGVAFRE